MAAAFPPFSQVQARHIARGCHMLAKEREGLSMPKRSVWLCMLHTYAHAGTGSHAVPQFLHACGKQFPWLYIQAARPAHLQGSHKCRSERVPHHVRRWEIVSVPCLQRGAACHAIRSTRTHSIAQHPGRTLCVAEVQQASARHALRASCGVIPRRTGSGACFCWRLRPKRAALLRQTLPCSGSPAVGAHETVQKATMQDTNASICIN